MISKELAEAIIADCKNVVAPNTFIKIDGDHVPVINVSVPKGGFTYKYDTEDVAHVRDAVMAMCFALTGDTSLPENLDCKLLKNIAVDEEAVKNFIEVAGKVGLIPEKLLSVAYDETVQNYKNGLGRWVGFCLRHYPNYSEGVHPYIVAGYPDEAISEPIKKNAAEQWEALDEASRGQYGSLEIYTKFLAASAVDQLARAIYSLKNGGETISIQLNMPCTLMLNDRGIREQPLFDRVAAFSRLKTLTFSVIEIAGTGRLTAAVDMDSSRYDEIIETLVPMFTFLLSKVAEEVGLEPLNVRFRTSSLLFASSEKTISDMKNLLTKPAFTRMREYPDFVPNKRIIDYTSEDLVKKGA